MIPLFTYVYPTLPGNGWLTEPEAELLWKVANLSQGPILEVGSYHGRSTCLLAATGRQVYAVDPFDGFTSDHAGNDIEAALRLALKSRGLTNVEIFRQRVEDWKPRPVGFAYLDGDHTYIGTVAQIEAAKACGAKYIAVHDVNDKGDGAEIKRACLRLLGSWSERAERLAVWLEGVS